MNDKLTNLIEFIIRIKIYLSRSMSYAAMMNSAMLLVILLTDMEKYGIKVPVAAYFFQIMIVGVILMILWGYLEDKLGMWRYEQTIHYDRSDLLTGISTKIDILNKKIDKVMKKW